MRKSELISDIMLVINWVNEQSNNELNKKLHDALNGTIWYASSVLMQRVLMRVKKEKLEVIRHDVVEAIY